MGKAQPLDAKIKTTTGWKRMGDLKLGDELASIDGRHSLVSGIFPQGVQPVFRVTFSDGRSTTCTGEHLWRVHYRGWPEPRVLETQHVAELLGKARYRHRLWIDAPSGDFGGTETLPVDPYVLGALLGDGTLSGSSLRFSTAEREMLDRMIERASPAFSLRAAGGYDWRIVQTAGAHRAGVAGVTPNALMDSLRTLGLWGRRAESKFIPEIYLNASRAERAELLRGWCSVRSRRTTYCYGAAKKEGRTAFVCNIHHPDPRGLFHLSAKRERAQVAPRRRWRPVFASIEPAGETQTQCIAVTHPSRLYVTDDYVVTHNTAFALNIAQHVGIALRGRVLVLSLEMSSQQIVQRMLC